MSPNSPLPETKANFLVDKINALVKSGEHNEFVIATVKKEAKALLNVDAVSGYTVLGMIASFERDVSEMHRNHKLAVSNARNAIWPAHNYASSLINNGFYKEGSELAVNLHEREPLDLLLLELAIIATIRAGDVKSAVKLSSKKEMLHWNSDTIANDILRAVRALAFLDSENIEPSSLFRAASMAQEVAHASAATIRGAGLLVLTDESEFLTYKLLINASARKLTELDLALIDKLVDEWQEFPADKLSIGFTAANK